MFEALGTARDNLEKAGTNTDLWLTIDAFEYLHDDPCLPVDRAGSGLPEMLNRVTKSRIDWALTAASWNVQKVASLAFDPGFTCRTNKHPSPLVFQIKQDKTRPIIAKCFFHSNFNRSVVVIGYNLEAETQGFTVILCIILLSSIQWTLFITTFVTTAKFVIMSTRSAQKISRSCRFSLTASCYSLEKHTVLIFVRIASPRRF